MNRGVASVAPAGILEVEPEAGSTTRVGMQDAGCYLVSESSGLVEYGVGLGERVSRGSVVARIHDVNRTGAPPTDYRAGIDGILIGRHFPGLIAMGDVIGVVGVPDRAGGAEI